jgi:hypothetical protein
MAPAPDTSRYLLAEAGVSGSESVKYICKVRLTVSVRQ